MTLISICLIERLGELQIFWVWVIAWAAEIWVRRGRGWHKDIGCREKWWGIRRGHRNKSGFPRPVVRTAVLHKADMVEDAVLGEVALSAYAYWLRWKVARTFQDWPNQLHLGKSTVIHKKQIAVAASREGKGGVLIF